MVRGFHRTSGSCQAIGSAVPGRASPSSPSTAATGARILPASQGSGRVAYSEYTHSRSRKSKPASSVFVRSASSFGHGASGLTWSGVIGDTPPQSLIPASSSRG